LLQERPTVYLGPGALGALEKGFGILLGARRPAWVDLLFYEPVAGLRCKGLVERRFDSRAEAEVVGIVLSPEVFKRHQDSLLRELVAGDVALTVPGKGRPQAFVNLGDEWAATRLKVSRVRGLT
jgi:hypothetical protein